MENVSRTFFGLGEVLGCRFHSIEVWKCLEMKLLGGIAAILAEQ